ncbi:two-component sensor histidine kinase [Paenibacillus macquariensis subsp. macquariensis]|nr:two-component sensor histidine kinase [Paenibacillus macquariensis subsp. macquariensis]
MMVRKLYRNYFKNNVFLKMITLYSGITIVTIITLSYLMFRSMSQSIVEKELDIQKNAMESVSQYLDAKYVAAKDMTIATYRNESLSSNLSFFLTHPFQEYAQHKLDQYYNDNADKSTDVLEFLKDQLNNDPDIRNLMLYSADQQNLFTFDQNKHFNMVSTNAAHSYIPDSMAQESTHISLPNVWIRTAINQWDSRLFSVRVPLNDKMTLKNIGQLLVFYDADKISNVLSSYKGKLKGDIAVISVDGRVLYDSSSQYYEKSYPYTEQLSLYSDKSTQPVDKAMYINKLTSNEGGYMVIGVVPKHVIGQAYNGLRNTIIMIGALCIIISIVIPALFVANYAKRTSRIIKFTRKVKNGDLEARIEDNREDELGQISKSFNNMMDDLNLYIDRVFKAEIKQKHTELAALQARINPHFLYNTLEVIRMRAISQGADDVSEMIYILSVLFKSLVQQKEIHLFKDELEACRLYLELFRIRFKDKFSFQIEIDPIHSSRVVMKMSLQPLIENYIVHGIRTERTDNHLSIRVLQEIGFIKVVIEDNGRGIESERLAQIKDSLDKPEEEGGSFGLRSVHARLKLLYGAPYGIDIQSELDNGTTVTVRFPDMEGEGDQYV